MRRRRFGFSAAHVARNCSSAPFVARSLGELAGELRALVEANLAACDRGPEPLLVVVQVLRVDALPLALDHVQPSRDVRRDGDEPWGR